MPSQKPVNKAKSRKENEENEPGAVKEPIQVDLDGQLAIAAAYISTEGLAKLTKLHLTQRDLEQTIADQQAALRVNMDDMNKRTGEWHRERAGLQTNMEDSKKEIGQLQGQLKAANEATKHSKTAVANLQSRLQDAEATIAHHVEDSRAKSNQIMLLEARIETCHQTAREAAEEKEKLAGDLLVVKEKRKKLSGELRDANASLATIRRFMVNLKQLEDQKVHIQGAFADLFTYAFEFFQKTFDQDLGDDVLKVRAQCDLSIPIPSSNSPVAKQMRAVGGLIISARAIDKHLFRRTFLMEGTEMEKVLSLLADKHPLQEAFLRAVLPKVLPEAQESIQRRCTQLAIDEISSAVQHWVSDKEAFDTGVELLCEKAIKCWSLVQDVVDRVTPSFAFAFAEDWHPLSLSKAKQNGSAKKEASPAFAPSDVVAVAWPALMASNPEDPASGGVGDQDLFHHGYVVTKAQVQAAVEEISKAESLHRTARRDSRTAEPAPRRRQNSFLNGTSVNSGAE